MSSQVLDRPAKGSTSEGSFARPEGRDGIAEVEIVNDTAASPGGSQVTSAAEAERAAEGAVSTDEQTVISRRNPQSSGSSPKSEPAGPASSPRADLGNVLEGTVLGHFRLEKFVGGGGMGSVFRGTDLRLGRTVAVKVLSRDRTEPETLRRFQNEAQSAARLDHDNIARVYYVGEDHGLHFIVFEYIEGVNIRDLVEKQGPLPLAEAISYLLQVAEALEHASQRHVVHRDIKPSNILVTAAGRAKLVDMGLARLRMESDREDLTASGVTLGTFDYISPEQARDPRIADVRSDLYSLGCTFYFMLTGRPPFPEGTLLQKLLSHSSELPADPRLVRPDLDEQVAGIVNRLLAKQPRDRYQQPNELIGELLLVADRLHLPGLNVTGAVWLGSRRSVGARIERTLPWLLPVALLFLSVFVLERLTPDPGGPRTNEPPAKALPPRVEAAGKPPTAKAAKPDRKSVAAPTAGIASGQSGGPKRTPDRNPVQSRDAASSGPQPKSAPTAAEPPLSTQQTTTPAVRVPADQAPPAGPTTQAPESPPAAIQVEPRALAPASPAGSPTGKAPPAAIDASVADARTPASASINAVTRIIVSATEGPLPADAKSAMSLAAACQQAAALGVETIELHFDGLREERAFDIPAAKLMIRNGPGFRPTLVFRPGFEDLAGDRRMIRARGSSLAWSGVHLEFELPDEPVDDWVLFSLAACEVFELQDAVLTVRNANEQGRTLQDRVTLLEVGGEPRAEPVVGVGAGVGAEASAKRAIPPYLGLDNCLVRGQATLLNCPQAVPLRISARQCLFVLSENLLDVGGRETPPAQADARIELSLKNVTAVLGAGLCRLSSDSLTPYQLDLVTDCKNSILYLKNSQAALLERRGLRDLNELEKHLFVRGRDNFYPGSDLLLRLDPTDDPQDNVTFGFAGRSENWYQEESPRFMLLWNSLPADNLPLDQHLPADYLLDASDQNPALYDGGAMRAGVDTSLLPAPD